MFVCIGESHPRSLGKAVCWRLLGSIDTFALTLMVTGSIGSAGSVASVETLTKTILYYLHERAWSGIAWGRERRIVPQFVPSG